MQFLDLKTSVQSSRGFSLGAVLASFLVSTVGLTLFGCGSHLQHPAHSCNSASAYGNRVVRYRRRVEILSSYSFFCRGCTHTYGATTRDVHLRPITGAPLWREFFEVVVPAAARIFAGLRFRAALAFLSLSPRAAIICRHRYRLGSSIFPSGRMFVGLIQLGLLNHVRCVLRLRRQKGCPLGNDLSR